MPPMGYFLGLLALITACGADSSTDGKSVGGLSADACQPGDIRNLRVRVVDKDRECVDAYMSLLVGCASPERPEDLLTYFECWEDSETGQRVISPVPLENLRSKGSWLLCEDQEPRISTYKACQLDDCERHETTFCTFEDTCEQLSCGDGWSSYRANGCMRSKGDSCVTDDECEEPQVCSLFAPPTGFCLYQPDGSCFCHTNAIGPTEDGFCTDP